MTSQRTAIDTRRRRIAAIAALALPLATAARSARADDVRFALGMFHFNVQYVAGGLVGFPAYAGELRPAEVEDLIVRESLRPVLDLYAAHPSWGVNIELQAYLLDVLAARHPDTLDLLRDLALAGQVEVTSFHYSDQMFVTYPAADWEHSQDLTRATFEAHEIPLGGAVFCQEGQAGEGLATAMAARGYTTMVWPKNLWIYQHGELAPAPFYRFGDVSLVVGALGVDYADAEHTIATTWTYFDDGELLATADWNPYFPSMFHLDPASVAAYEAELAGLEADGWVIGTISDYAARIDGLVEPATPPPLLDGTWQPNSTRGVAKWLGDRSIWQFNGPPADRDNAVRTLGSIAHREIVAAETAAAVAGLDAGDELAAAWRLLALGQVTDASGINPYRGEVEYGLAHLAEATRIARDVIERSRSAETITIDPRAGTVIADDAPPFTGGPGEAMIEVEAMADDPARAPVVSWESIAPGHGRVTIAFGPAGDADAPWPIAVVFHGDADAPWVTTRALVDDAPASYAREDFTFSEFQLALPVGMISLGTDRFLVADQASVHLAATITPTSGDVVFRDETQPADAGVTWVFHVIEGTAEDAVALADAVNVRRAVVR